MKLPRSLRWWSRFPGLSIQYLLTIAIGMGTVSAVASIVIGLGFQPLPLYQPDRLVAVWETSRLGGEVLGVSAPDLADLAAGAGAQLRNLGPFTTDPMRLWDSNGGLEVRALMIDARTFAGLGVRTVLGRGPTATDRTVSAATVAPIWISNSLWQRRYLGRRNIVGAPIELGGESAGSARRHFRVMGVLAQGTVLPLPFLEQGFDVWYILPNTPDSRRDAGLFGVGRLLGGVTVAQAEAALNVAADNLGRKYRFDANKRVRVEALQVIADAPVRRTLGLVVLASCLAFLVACCNIAMLLLSVADRRRANLAIRRALGATSSHLWVDAAAGSIAITLIGLLMGGVLAWWAIHLLPSFLPALGVSGFAGHPAALRWPVIAGFVMAALLIALLWSGLLAGLRTGPALSAMELNCDQDAPSRRVMSFVGLTWRSAFIAGQACLAVVVIAVAGTAVHAYFAQSRAALGPSPDHTQVLDLNPGNEGVEASHALLWKQELLANVARTQGVVAAAFTDQLAPLGTPVSFTQAGDAPGTSRPAIPPVSVSSRYFQVFAIPILYGRGLSQADDRDLKARVTVVNETLAAENWPSPQQAVGAVITFGSGKYAERYQIVGVAADFGGFWFREIPPTAYIPESQSAYDGGTLIVRSITPPGMVAREVRSLVSALPANIQISSSSTISDRWGQTLTRPRARMDGMLLVALLTLGLAIQGIHVTATWMVQARRRELAVRIALGAGSVGLAVRVLSMVALPAAAGAAGGGLAATLFAPLIARWLGGAVPLSAGPMAAAVGLLVAAVAAGSLVPALAIARIDPIESIRHA